MRASLSLSPRRRNLYGMTLAACLALACALPAQASPAQAPPARDAAKPAAVQPETAPAARTGEAAPRSEAPLIKSDSEAGRQFRSTGRLRTNNDCTATLVHSAEGHRPTDKALILSNGHCAGSLSTNEVITDRPAAEGATFTPAFFKDNQADHVSYGVERVLYATMKDHDLALLRLNATYADLARHDIHPRSLAPAVLKPGTKLRAAHAPTSGVDDSEAFLRLSTCTAQANVALNENSWLWKDSTRTDCRGVAGGSSGSPAVAGTDGPIAGLINTVATPLVLGCGTGRPCEGDENGRVVPKDDTTYLTTVAPMAGCLTGRGFDLNRPGCGLDPGHRGLTLPKRAAWHTPSATEAGPVRWDTTIERGESGHTHAAVKVGRLGVVDCVDPRGYTTTELTDGRLFFDREVPATDGIYILCVAGGPDATLRGAAWDASLQHPAYAIAHIRNTAPTVEPEVTIRKLDSEPGDRAPRYGVWPSLRAWEIVSETVKYGPARTTDCADRSGYRLLPGDHHVTVEATENMTVCVIGYGEAGNASAPKGFPLPRPRS